MPRFSKEELSEALKRMDLTVRPETSESMSAHVALLEEMRPYRERTWAPTESKTDSTSAGA